MRCTSILQQHGNRNRGQIELALQEKGGSEFFVLSFLSS